MNFTTATLDEIREAGRDWGYSIASWQDLPEIGQKVPRELDWVGIGAVEHIEDAAEVFEMLCNAAEENARCYSPFEFTAKELNDREDSDEAWEAFDEGTCEGYAKNWNERKSYYDDC